jgi:type IV pilus assembly protein PilX
MNTSIKIRAGQASQRGVSLVVALVMLLVLTLIGVSSMNTAIVELKMAGSTQQQGIALNRADELLRVGEEDVLAIVTDPSAFDFSADGDGYYIAEDNINVNNIDWEGQGLNSIQGASSTDVYVTQYMGAKAIPGESIVQGKGDNVAGGMVHSFVITSRSEAGKSALRLVQSIYVTTAAP